MAAKNPLRVGKRVSVTRGGLYIGVGKIDGVEPRGNGDWYGVNFAQPRKPAEVRYYRAANLTPQ